MPQSDLFDLAYEIDYLNIELTEGAHRFVSELIKHYRITRNESDKERLLALFRALPPIYSLNHFIREIQDTGRCRYFDPNFNIGDDITNRWDRVKNPEEDPSFIRRNSGTKSK